MAASPAIDPGESLEALFKRARIADKFYRKCEGKLEDLGVGDAGDLLTVVAVKGIASLGLHELQAEKLRRTLLGRRTCVLCERLVFFEFFLLQVGTLRSCGHRIEWTPHCEATLSPLSPTARCL